MSQPSDASRGGKYVPPRARDVTDDGFTLVANTRRNAPRNNSSNPSDSSSNATASASAGGAPSGSRFTRPTSGAATRRPNNSNSSGSSSSHNAAASGANAHASSAAASGSTSGAAAVIALTAAASPSLGAASPPYAASDVRSLVHYESATATSPPIGATLAPYAMGEVNPTKPMYTRAQMLGIYTSIASSVPAAVAPVAADSADSNANANANAATMLIASADSARIPLLSTYAPESLAALPDVVSALALPPALLLPEPAQSRLRGAQRSTAGAHGAHGHLPTGKSPAVRPRGASAAPSPWLAAATPAAQSNQNATAHSQAHNNGQQQAVASGFGASLSHLAPSQQQLKQQQQQRQVDSLSAFSLDNSSSAGLAGLPAAASGAMFPQLGAPELTMGFSAMSIGSAAGSTPGSVTHGLNLDLGQSPQQPLQSLQSLQSMAGHGMGIFPMGAGLLSSGGVPGSAETLYAAAFHPATPPAEALALLFGPAASPLSPPAAQFILTSARILRHGRELYARTMLASRGAPAVEALGTVLQTLATMLTRLPRPRFGPSAVMAAITYAATVQQHELAGLVPPTAAFPPEALAAAAEAGWRYRDPVGAIQVRSLSSHQPNTSLSSFEGKDNFIIRI